MRRRLSITAGAFGVLLLGCGDRAIALDSTSTEGTTTMVTTSVTTSSSSTGVADETTVVGDDGIKHDTLHDTDGSDCDDCYLFDVLIVVDNSGTMAQEQAHVAANFAPLVEGLQALTDTAGNPLYPDVNIMVTTTDVGHPLCAPLQKPDYTPRAGAPVYDGCNARIARFTGLGENPAIVEEACTSVCPEDIAPADQFLHFDYAGTNVPNDAVASALACIGPQGIDGCEYESPLEAMLRALDPEACWNDPEREGCADDPEWGQFDKPFLRDGADLIVMIIADDTDCSVDAPDGYTYFTNPDDDQYQEIDPETSMRSPSSAICENAGVSCEGPDANGTYTNCVSTDNPVLHSTDRYLDALRSFSEVQDKAVYMFGILGVPSVTAHNPQAPFEPTEGGVHALEQRLWNDADLTAAEIDAGVTVAHKIWEFGDIAPGCANELGSAVFPTRVQEVCEGLNQLDDPATRDIDESWSMCFIESICDDDYSDVFRSVTVWSQIFK